MTSEEIIALAFQCGIWIPLASGPEREQTIDRLLRLAALVASAERAACAQIAREEIIDFLRMTINDGRLARDFEAGNRVAARIESLILRRGES